MKTSQAKDGASDPKIFGEDGQQDCINGGSGDDLLYRNESQDTLNCDSDNDSIIYGGKDSDLLKGRAGDDWLFGDRGDDTLSRGIGGDRFALSANSGIDTVLNFSVGTDKFVLAEDLSFEALRINSTANGTLLQFAATGEVLGQVFRANNAITTLDFVAVAR
jgi:Ca2+-binding RTX toxin-like protein